MKKCLVVSGFLLSSVLAHSLVFKHYCNARFGFCLDYPSTLFLQPPPDNGDGRTFKSKDGKVQMLAYGSYNSLQEKLKTRFLAESTSSGTRKITYKLFKPDFFVISGIENNKVFYERILYKDDTYKTLLISYPTALKKTYDPITAKIALSFKHSQ